MRDHTRHHGRSLFGALLITAQLIIAQAVTASAADLPAEHARFFEAEVRPILLRRCVECHGEKKQESGLRLDSRAAVIAGGDSGQTVVAPGKPEESLLLSAVRYHGDIEMPPKQKLPDAQIAALQRWIRLGAPWPKSAETKPKSLTGDALLEHVRRTHWSLQPVVRPKLTNVKDRDWPRGPIDRFILARLENAGLAPSEPLDRRRLIRRVCLDVVGLPPTAEETDAFLADRSPDAYSRLVDRLLSAPQFGERWGRHWLDVARYADTKGYAFGRERRFPYAYTYRDYVIAALNADKPYDRFIVEQLAADRLDLGGDPRPLAALGFLTVGRKYNNGPDDIDDQIDAVTRGLLGVTVSCARCHDHKYDAISIEDYYALYGVFASSQAPERLPLIDRGVDHPGYAAFKQKLDQLTADRNRFRDAQHRQVIEIARKNVAAYLAKVVSNDSDKELGRLAFISLSPGEIKPALVNRWRIWLRQNAHPDHPVFGPWRELSRLPEEDFAARAKPIVERWTARQAGVKPGRINPRVRAALRSNKLVSKVDLARVYGKLLTRAYAEHQQGGKLPAVTQQLADVLLADDSPTQIPLDDLRQYITRANRNKLRSLQKKIDSHEVNSPAAPPRAMSLVDVEQPITPRVFVRGNPRRRGPAVERRFLRLLEGPSPDAFQGGSGRLELARRIVHPTNPLTRRVIINRVWSHYFGRPLVVSPSDFGVRSEPPSHPLLLDYLADRLLGSDWSLKALHREILRSAAYRQTAADRPACREEDPENRLLWRQNRRRLELEPLRDAMLQVAGRLDLQQGGRPVEITRRPYTRRRAVYAFIDRQDLPGLFRTFDFANPDQSSPGRPQTTVPQQALFLMNAPFVIEQAQAVTQRPAFAEADDRDARLTVLYRLILAREPDETERRLAERFLSHGTDTADRKSQLTPWQQLAQILLLTNEFTHAP